MKKLKLSLVVGTSLLLALPSIGSAEPPSWAPAHGYRNKHKHEGDEEVKVIVQEPVVVKETVVVQQQQPVPVPPPDAGISRGTCNRDKIGAVIGGIAGGVIGAQIGKDQGNQNVGLVAGAIIGVLAGKTIGERMDDKDRQCTAHTLDQARDGHPVAWQNPENGTNYTMTPISTFKRDNLVCRKYEAVTTYGKDTQKIQREACRQPDGSWRVVETPRP